VNQGPPASSFIIGPLLGLFFNLKMEATRFSERWIDFHQTIRCYVVENRILHKHGCENSQRLRKGSMRMRGRFALQPSVLILSLKYNGRTVTLPSSSFCAHFIDIFRLEFTHNNVQRKKQKRSEAIAVTGRGGS
jgi:hypothetical protein